MQPHPGRRFPPLCSLVQAMELVDHGSILHFFTVPWSSYMGFRVCGHPSHVSLSTCNCCGRTFDCFPGNTHSIDVPPMTLGSRPRAKRDRGKDLECRHRIGCVCGDGTRPFPFDWLDRFIFGVVANTLVI